ncbi:unnamed protein product [Microthlaspi erraticum]|uniref:Uncharacterized protein n=1 Tax=Microthlaspi erraticum TaxID=1685480 RepID=A0A6D2IDB6_9BRAS|nr:unnamed protein product [Microthlaspi erraticum]
MKSHDCHVLMQRLLPIAFSELLDESVHNVLSISLKFGEDESGLTRDHVHIYMSCSRQVSRVLYDQCPYDHAWEAYKTAMPAVGSVVSGSCDTNMVIGGPNDVDGNRDYDRQQSMDGELHCLRVISLD